MERSGFLYYWIGTQPSEAREQSDPLQLLGIAAGAGFGGIAPLRARLATIRLHLRDEVHRGPLPGSAIPHQQIPIIP